MRGPLRRSATGCSPAGLGALCRLVDGIDAAPPRGARGDQGRRALHQDHGERRRRLARPTRSTSLGFSRRARSRRWSRRRPMPAPTSPPISTPTRRSRRAVDCGVRSLEHCNLIRRETARRAAKAKGAVAVPTLVDLRGAGHAKAPRLGLGRRVSVAQDRERCAAPASSCWQSCARPASPMAYRQRPPRRDAPPPVGWSS